MRQNNISFKIFIAASLLIVSVFSSCKKLVDVDVPGNRITAGSVYQNDATAIAVLNGIYTALSGTNYSFGATIPTISMWAGLSADELTLWSGSTFNSQIVYFKNSLSSNAQTGGGGEFWYNIYPYIYTCNVAIEGLSGSTSLSPGVKKQLLGEAKFLRAFFYFYLVNLYGEVPLVLSTDYTVNSTLPRTSIENVYLQIEADLKDAQSLLAENYVKPDLVTLYPSSAERVRPSKAVATAMLARTYLYKGLWSNAEAEATKIISNVAVYDTVSLNNVFLKNNKEAIWQLQPVQTSPANTAEAYLFILNRAPVGVNSTHPVYLSNSLLNSFEIGDQRKSNGNWVNVYTDATGTYYYPYKYKDVANGAGVNPTEYTTLLRLGEIYLIRAEARAQLNNIIGAQNDLNIIRIRARLNNTVAADKSSLLQAIYKERQVELFTELGHRWLDIKRTGTVNSVMTAATTAKGGTWSSHQQLYPIFESELLRNPYLVQTSGY